MFKPNELAETDEKPYFIVSFPQHQLAGDGAER